METIMRIFIGTFSLFLSVFFAILLSLFFTMTAYADDFSLTTDAFLDTGALPVLYTCDGKNISPKLMWANPPPKTKSYAILLSDPDAPGGTFYHWVVYNIPAATKELAEGIKDFPSGTLIGNNSWNKNQYNGPCPPKGTAHTYFITLYALNAPISIPAGADGNTVLKNIQGHIIKKVQLSTVYSRWLK
jgi:Raf kinase inhibitor-like YbhB/YbcL family protein